MEEKKGVTTDVKEMGMRELAPGYIRFSIKADDTEENQAVHDAFKEFCKVETDNSYTQGLRKLMEYYQGDFKYELLNNAMNELRVLVDDLKSSVVSLNEKPKEEESDDASF